MSRPVSIGTAALVALTLIRLCLAYIAPLAPDEAYYWVWSRALAPGYLDHPPMVALWIRIGTDLAGQTPLGVRLLAPLSAALGSWLLYDAAEHLFPERRAGLTAAALLNATLALGLGSVVMSPDTPLLLFWTATLWAGARIAGGGAPAWWLVGGLFAGLALDSKYTAAFLPVGLGLYVLVASPGWMRRREVWLGGALAGLLFAPVVFWNFRHGWVGFLRQGGRVADWRPDRALGFLAELFAGQFGLATPGVAVLFVAGIVMAIRMTTWTRDPAWSLLAAFSVPPGLVFLQHALGDRVQGNWPAIVYPAAAIAASGLAGPVWRRLIWPSCGLGFAIAVLLYAHVLSGWPSLPDRRDPVARQLLGWNDLAERAEAARQAAGADFIAAEPYAVAAQLAWALQSGVVGAGSHWISFELPPADLTRQRGILIRPERYGAPDAALWSDAIRLAGIVRSANDNVIDRYGVYLVHPAGGTFVGVVLPHR